jgi:ATP-dependent DNA helicase PIF1
MNLSKEQQIAFDKYIEGDNIFITGPGGSGKSALIQKINEHSRRTQKEIHVCALTGCAAVLLNANATTIHSWAGIGLGNGTIEQLILKIKANKYSKKMWKQTEVLVVDEVSMLSLKLFDALNQIGKALRGNNRPFGGIQLVFSGDFYQLPPVGNKEDINTMRFCFESDDWNSIFHRDCQIQLIKIFRQKEASYTSLLNQVREGKIKRKSYELLLSRTGGKPPVNPPKARDDVGVPSVGDPFRTGAPPVENKKAAPEARDPVGALSSSMGVYGGSAPVVGALSSSMGVYGGGPPVVVTKLFPTKNKVDTINKTEMAALTGEERDYKMKFKTDPDKKGRYTENEIQYELDYLSNNLICEKSLKMKVGAQVMCIVNIQPEKGSGTGLEVCNGSQGIITHFCPLSGSPCVKYNNGREMVMTRHCWSSEKIPGIGVLQIPLILAWALTIHKSQGATLDAAEIDVGSGIFECGQTYVALSRVKSLAGLFLSSFDITKIRINKKVKDYYDALTLYQDKAAEVFVPIVCP